MGYKDVLIDLDGVIRDWVEGLVKTYKKNYPNHAIKPILSRAIEDSFPIGAEIDDFIRQNQNDISENAPPYPGSLETLHAWQEKFNIIIVTSQEEYAVNATIDWIKRYQLPVKDIIITFEKEKVNGIALLDDFIYNLERFNAPGRYSVCLDQPWNTQWRGLRVKTINDFFILLEKDELNFIKN